VVEAILAPEDRADFMEVRFWSYLKRRTIDACKSAFAHTDDIEGTVYEYEGESDTEKQIGDLRCFLVQPGLAEEKQIHLFDPADSISDETAECYEAVFDLATNDWNADIEDLYAGGPVGVDLLFIEQIRLDDRHRGKGIGRNAVREIIETFGLQCGLVVCKPFQLEYSGWAEKYSAAQQAEPEFDRKKRRRLKVCRSSGKSQFHSTSGFRLLRSLSGDS
jgi:hypothetical protein